MIPEVGTIWQHRNGNKYTVAAIANEHSQNMKYPITVVYIGENGHIWSRLANDWKRSFTQIGDKYGQPTQTDQGLQGTDSRRDRPDEQGESESE